MKITLPVECPHCHFEYDMFVPAEDLVRRDDNNFQFATECGNCETDFYVSGTVEIEVELDEPATEVA